MNEGIGTPSAPGNDPLRVRARKLFSERTHINP